jgi:hypothetical protein
LDNIPIYVIFSPTGPYIRSAEGNRGCGIALLAMGDQVRAILRVVVSE